MEEQIVKREAIKAEITEYNSENVQKNDAQEGEDDGATFLDLDSVTRENQEIQAVVLQNIQLGDSNDVGEIEIIRDIISQTNSDGNLQINTVEDDNVIRTYIINNAEYKEIDGQTVLYEEIGEDDENSIEYIIEESVDYEENENGVSYTEVVVGDEYEYTIEDEQAEENELEQEEYLEERLTDHEDNEGIVEEERVDEERIEDYQNETSEKFVEIKEEHVACDICNKIFKTSAGLKRHITVNHERKDEDEGDDPLTFQLCPCCGEPWDSAHTIGDYKCEQCDKLFMQANFLQRHLSIEHPKSDALFTCVECRKEFNNKKDIIDHMRVHPTKIFKCLECNKDFTRKYHLDRHIKQMGCMGQPRKMFDCRVCKRLFSRKDNLAEHLRIHAGQVKKKRKFTCHFCSKQFQGFSLLSIHLRTHTGEKPFACEFCPKRFPSAGAMAKHRRRHTGEKPYKCEVCGRTFTAKETLNRHTRIHTGDKPHQCKFCGKAFIQPSQLRAHIFHHTGENAYTCTYCGRAFNRKLRLTNHIKYMHEGAEPLPCPKCEKTFFRKEDVARHMLSHSGEKPFKCEQCDKAFAVKSSLKMHMNTHRKEPPCSCDTCGRAFIRRDCLMRHIRARHRDVLEDILTNAEKKRLQQQLLSAATESANENLSQNIIWNELTLTESIKELLTLLVDDECLLEFGYPDAPVDKVLDSVIKKCGHVPASEDDFDYIGRIRENAKLLFTVVIDDEAVKELLNNQTVDEVILHVLRLAKKQSDASS